MFNNVSLRVVLWDLILLIPNVLFVLFLLVKWLQVRVKLRNIRFPILTVFLNMVCLDICSLEPNDLTKLKFLAFFLV